MKKALLNLTLMALAGLAGSSSWAAEEIKIGLTGTFTGANASNGIPYRNAAELYPDTLGGRPATWIVLDDGGDATAAIKNARRFIDVDKVDAIVGSTSTPTAMAIFGASTESETVQFAMSPVVIPEDQKTWIFNIPQPVDLMTSAIIEDMKKQNVESVAFMGYTDGWGDMNWDSFQAQATKAGMDIVAEERYARTDTSVTGQVLKIIGAQPDAVFLGASGTPSVLPQASLRDLGFDGPIYQTHGSASQAFLDAGGRDVEGARLPTGPMVAVNDLPDDNPIKAVSQDFIEKYQAKWGDGPVSPLAGYAWDAMLVLDHAAAKALQQAEPGTAEFRSALRDALESGDEVPGTNAVYRYTADDHYGIDDRARVMVEVKDGAFRLVTD